MKGLGRRVPKTWEHIEKYPLMLGTPLAPKKAVPVVAGVNWYDNFDRPVKKGHEYWVGLDKNNLGSIRGGHCICIPHKVGSDLYSWHTYYNQGSEGACVGYGSSRMMTLLNRRMYVPRWLWDQAKMIDEWEETNPGDNEGTSVNAAMKILRVVGHIPKGKEIPDINQGIIQNVWAKNIDDNFSVLQNELYKKRGAMPFHNNWGKDYPHTVWMPCETWDRLIKEDGEFTMVTDR